MTPEQKIDQPNTKTVKTMNKANNTGEWVSERKRVRKEVHSRQTFAYERGLFWFNKIQHEVRSGNIFSCKATRKWLQARRIYIHYANEFQICQKLPLSV